MENIIADVKNFHHKKFSNDIELKENENYYPNELTRKTIEEAERGINMYGPYDTIEELMKDLMEDIGLLATENHLLRML